MAGPRRFLACIRLPVNEARKAALRSRLKHHRPSEIIEAINRIPRSKSLMGERPGRFYGKGLTITSLLRPTTNMIQRILEGEFDDGPEPAPGTRPRQASYRNIR